MNSFTKFHGIFSYIFVLRRIPEDYGKLRLMTPPGKALQESRLKNPQNTEA